MASEELTIAFRKIHQYLSFSVNAPAQFALANYLEIFDVEANRLQMQQKRDFFVDAFRELPFTLKEKAEAGYFQILGYENISALPDKTCAVWLTEHAKVASIPISAFYKNNVNTPVSYTHLDVYKRQVENHAERHQIGFGQSLFSVHEIKIVV